jgi:hypothetical protein
MKSRPLASPLLKILLPLLALLLLAAACGSDSDETSSEDTEMSDDEMGDMGDPDAIPAYEVEGAELTTGTFILLDTRPEGYDDVIGEANLARHDGGTTVTIELAGLVADVDYIAHVHEGDCADNGGNHYKFDPEGGDMPPNEIHLAFVADDGGAGFMTAEHGMVAGEDARSIVVHPVDLLDNKIACAPL